jgi:hypothetical protein
MVSESETEQTEFLNVDFDILSASPLESLARAFGSSVSVLYVGKEGDHFGAHFEIRKVYGKNAEQLVREFVALVKNLPSSARRLWDGATSRDFNVGVQGGFEPRMYETALSSAVLRLIAEVGGCLTFTVHAAARPKPALRHSTTARKPSTARRS